ncbi:MAG TPA: 16S rRNA (cytidine(1402)-2'-O)-methyltransferase [Terriglobia bacterium]|nr:16S rRNA (cytidine(1402)-2'-O)-methyltransferase [Terriglobia bacterium]
MPQEKHAERNQPPSKGTVGTLYVVGTPIGNFDDITLRALRTLKEVDLVACEDTRHTQQLLNHYSISTRTISYHQHNEMTRAPELIVKMEGGSQVALVSDAGMPGISDPGYRLVQLAIRHEVRVVPIPGASAFVAALSAAGLPVDKFRFLGFLPSKKLARRGSLQTLEGAEGSLVFYESPHRIIEMLQDTMETLGDRPCVVAREVTKFHEEFVRGPVSDVLVQLMKKPAKGEITVIVGPLPSPKKKFLSDQLICPEIEHAMSHDAMDERGALKAVARRRGISKSEAYRQWQAEKSRLPKS